MVLSGNGFLLRALILFVFTLVALPAVAALKPWCKQEGDPRHPLSLERMALGPLLEIEVRRDPVKMARAVLGAYRRAQQKVREERNEAPIAEAQAFEDLLASLAEGNFALSTHFVFKIFDRGKRVKLVGSEYPGGEVVFDCRREAPRELAQSNPQKANIGYTAYLMRVLLGEQRQVLMRFYADQVAKKADTWQAYLKNGLPMWPWELVVNSWGEDYHDLAAGPPRWQWVVMRPSAGFEIYWPNRKDATLEASVAVEPIGFVRYTDVKTYRRWWGLSALVTLGSDDNGVGLGGLLRYNNYALGVVRRRDVDDSYVFLSFDLYEKVRETRVRAEEARAQLEALKQKWAQYK